MDAAPGPGTRFSFNLNGETVSVAGANPQTTMLDFLRERGLTGAKEGCAEGECGACTVAMLQPAGHGSAYVPVNSCLMFLAMAAGREIYTVEALARNGALHPVQSAIAERGGSQCGYCTPGFVMSLFAEYYRPDREGACDPHALGGNLCRCTGYRPLRDAALSLGPAPEDDFRKRLAQPLPLASVSSGPGFSRPQSVAECLLLLAEDPAARLICGGTDLVVEANLRGREFLHLISTEFVAELRIFRDSDAELEIGAALTLSEIGALWRDAPAVVKEWLPLFASPLIRNRATLGGNLGTASPIGDAAPLLLALDALVKIAGSGGTRVVALSSFFVNYRQTALQPGEMLVSVLVPKPFLSFARFFKAAKRRLDDISTVAACFAITLDAEGKIQSARFSYGGVAAVPRRVVEAENAVLGRAWNPAAARDAARIVSRTLTPLTDHRGSAAYRLALAQSLLEKFCHESVEAAA